MNTQIQRIKKVSKRVAVGLMILAILLTFTIIWSFAGVGGTMVGWPDYDIARMTALRILLLAVTLQAAHIFYKIYRAGTPFISSIAGSFKALAFLVGLSLAVPAWVYQIASEHGLVILGGDTFLALLCGGMVFCFAIVFEYGCQLQAENDETL